MIDRTTTVEDAVDRFVRSGQVIMVGGFGRGGVPFTMVECIADHPDKYRDLTLVKNDANEPGIGIDLLLASGMVRKLVSTHIGLNPDFIARMNRGEIECELMPQGIFAERIRAGGAGIPAFLTDIGIGTEVAAEKPTVELDGQTFLLERAMRGDLALVAADRADRMGNAWFRGSNRNMNVVMASACERVVVEAREIVEPGAILPEDVHLPCVFVDAVVNAAQPRHLSEENAR